MTKELVRRLERGECHKNIARYISSDTSKLVTLPSGHLVTCEHCALTIKPYPFCRAPMT